MEKQTDFECGDWRTEQRRWLVVYGAGPENERLAKNAVYDLFLLDTVGWVRAVRIGTQLYGSRFDEIMMIGWAPEPISDIHGQDMTTTQKHRLWTWYRHSVLCRFGPGSWLRRDR